MINSQVGEKDRHSNMKVCQGCVQPDYCRNQATCHYTGSPMLEPDGSLRAEWSISSDSKQNNQINHAQHSTHHVKHQDLKACSICIQPNYCCGNAICHYTGSPMLEPDGSIREEWKA